MASYSVTLFKNSGYNVINTPDTPARLIADSITETLPSVNILQNRRLPSVLVACTNDSAEAADYIKIGSMYYAIVDFKMQSTSTCLFKIVEKPLLSVGGISRSDTGASANFDILDGVTSRCTVKDDTWGAYTSEDPLTAPQEPLQLQTEWITVSGGTTADTISGDPILIESTIDLPEQAARHQGVTATDSETGETVTYPKTYPIGTSKGDGTFNQVTNFDVDGSVVNNGTAVFCKNDTYKATGEDQTGTSYTYNEAGQAVFDGLQEVQALGVASGSILNQWRLPKEFCGGITVNHYVQGSGATAEDNATGQNIQQISGVSGSTSSTISPDYATVNNKRVLYGDYNRYGMITCAGSSAEFKPEDLGSEKAPSISYKSDPRPKGKPYYRFTTINGDSDFWRNSLAGAEWENVPLVYQGASGSALTRLNFNNERALKSLQKSQFETNQQFTLFRDFSGGASNTVTAAFEGSAAGGIPGAIAGGVLAGINSGANLMQDLVAGDQYKETYNQQKANELSGLYQATEVYAPTVNFPYNADILRDVKGNGVLIYKYRMSDNDVLRVDKLLTMYGYRTAEPLTLENFQRREKFDYVACSTVTVTGSYPQWLLDDIADELKNGIRIWHVKPDSSAYGDNPVRS